MTQIFLVKPSGERVMVVLEALRKDDKTSQLLQHACGALAASWMKTLERQGEVTWLTRDSKPFLRIRKDGVLLQAKNGVDEFIRLNQMQLKNGFAMMVEVWNDNRKLAQSTLRSELFCYSDHMLIEISVRR
jgi:hypothetical protein